MQQVLNSQERNQAFLKFLLFFLITVVLVIAAIFFNFRLPVRENKMLQSEVDIRRVQDVNQEKFAAKMQDVTHYLDSLKKSTANFEQIGLLVNSKLGELSVLQQNDLTIYGRIDKIIVTELYDLQQQITALHEQGANAEKLQNMQTELDKVKSENIQLNGQLDQYRKGTGIQ